MSLMIDIRKYRLAQINIPDLVPGELAAALVLSKCASARLDSVDASQALSLPGVEAFVDHRYL